MNALPPFDDGGVIADDQWGLTPAGVALLASDAVSAPDDRGVFDVDAAEAEIIAALPVEQTVVMGGVAFTRRRPCDYPVQHHFQPGCYLREILMPAGEIIIGHRHKTEHLNIILTGRARVWMEGEVREVRAGDVIKSAPGVRKVLRILETMRWITVHPTDLTDLAEIEELIIDKSEAFLADEAKRAVTALNQETQTI